MIKVFLIFIFFGVYTDIAFARSARLVCEQAPLSDGVKEKIKAEVKETEEYKNLAHLNSSTLKLSLSRCQKTEGEVKLSFLLLKDIFKKKCSINSLNFPYVVTEKGIDFADIRYSQKVIEVKELNRAFLKKSFEKMASSKAAASFFKRNNFCQIEYHQSGDDTYWIIQLRDENKRICFLKSSFDGSSVDIIERLYAKESQC